MFMLLRTLGWCGTQALPQAAEIERSRRGSQQRRLRRSKTSHILFFSAMECVLRRTPRVLKL